MATPNKLGRLTAKDKTTKQYTSLGAFFRNDFGGVNFSPDRKQVVAVFPEGSEEAVRAIEGAVIVGQDAWANVYLEDGVAFGEEENDDVPF